MCEGATLKEWHARHALVERAGRSSAPARRRALAWLAEREPALAELYAAPDEALAALLADHAKAIVYNATDDIVAKFVLR